MLIDTSGFFCLLHKDEQQNIEAVEFYMGSAIRLTHSYVLAEFVPLAQIRGLPRTLALDFCQRILDDNDIEIVWVDEVLHRMAVNLMQAREDKTYSLCDAVSFVLMHQRGIQDALTTDRHFMQEGFHRLLQP